MKQEKYHVPLMDEDAQRLFINSMLSNHELFAKVNPLMKPEFFDPHLAKGVRYLQEYFQENRAVPASQIFEAATKLKTEKVELLRNDLQYVSEQIAEFCRFRAVIEAVKAGVALIEAGDLGAMVKKIKEANEISLVQDLGIDYFAESEARLDRHDIEDVVISTGWADVDEDIGGGIGRQELVLLLAPSGGGKSVGMLNLGYNLLKQKLNGVYISLEMKDTKVATRTDQMISRISSGRILENKTQVVQAIESFSQDAGRFFIKRMREGSTNANHIIAYLRELEAAYGFRPDFVIVDYLDLMAPVQKGAGDSLFLKDKFVAEEVRAIGMDFDCIMISASQLGKHATDAINDGRTMHQGDIQGGSSKTNTSDLIIAMVKTEAMHEAGEYRFEYVKARNSDATGKKRLMRWDKISLRITDVGDLSLTKKNPGTLGLSAVRPGSKNGRLQALLDAPGDA